MTKRYKMGDSWPCATCGKLHKLDGLWLAAHWGEPLSHTCEDCGAVHWMRAGRINQTRKGKVKGGGR